MAEEELDQDQSDEKACWDHIKYWLEKYNCVLTGQCVITSGQNPIIQIGINKLPPEVIKQIKKAKKNGQSA